MNLPHKELEFHQHLNCLLGTMADVVQDFFLQVDVLDVERQSPAPFH